MSALVSVWSCVAIVLASLIGFVIQLALLLVTLPFDRNRRVAGRCFRRIGITAAALIPPWHFATFGPIPRRIRGRTVVVSNHASHADPFLISRLPWEMKWLGKSSLFNIPVIGWSMRLAGDVPVHRGQRDSVERAMQKLKRWLERDMPVIVFPEGTRSPDGELLPFKDGAFRLALETGSEILPIAVAGTRDALPKHTLRFGEARGRVAVGEPIPSAGRSVDDLKRAAREQIEGLLAKLSDAGFRNR